MLVLCLLAFALMNMTSCGKAKPPAAKYGPNPSGADSTQVDKKEPKKNNWFGWGNKEEETPDSYGTPGGQDSFANAEAERLRKTAELKAKGITPGVTTQIPAATTATTETGTNQAGGLPLSSLGQQMWVIQFIAYSDEESAQRWIANKGLLQDCAVLEKLVNGALFYGVVWAPDTYTFPSKKAAEEKYLATRRADRNFANRMPSPAAIMAVEISGMGTAQDRAPVIK